MFSRYGIVWAVAVLGSAVGAAGDAYDWASWRGPDGNGISMETNWNAAALSGGARIRWETNVGQGYASVGIQGTSLYTMGNDGRQDSVFCLAAETGQEQWRHSYPCKPGSYPGPRATPVIDGGRVYTVGREGQIFCLDAATGKVIWNRHLDKEWGARPPTWGHAASARIDGDRLILNAGRAGLALDKTTGKEIWFNGAGICNYATPVLFDADGQRWAVIMGEKELHGVDAKTGKIQWSYPWEESKYDINAAEPVVAGKRLFVSTGYGKGSELLEIQGQQVKSVWQSGRMANQFSSSVLIDGHIYGVDGNVGSGALTCMDVETGATRWRHPIGYGALSGTVNRLVVIDEKGLLMIVEASPDGFKLISSATVIQKPRCWTAPVLCRGLIYCRNSGGDLVCVDVK